MKKTKLILALILITFVYWVLFVNLQIHIVMYYELEMEGLLVMLNLFGNFFLCYAYALDKEFDFKNSTIQSYDYHQINKTNN